MRWLATLNALTMFGLLPVGAFFFDQRLRKDVAESGADLGALLDGLRDVRSLQYDVDMLTQKLKRFERGQAAPGDSVARVEATTAAAGMAHVAAVVASEAIPLQQVATRQQQQQRAAAILTMGEGMLPGKGRQASDGGALAAAMASGVDKENQGAAPRRSARHA